MKVHVIFRSIQGGWAGPSHPPDRLRGDFEAKIVPNFDDISYG